MAKALCLVDEVYEDLELWYPKIRLEEAGHTVDIAGPRIDVIYKGKHGYPCKADVAIDAVKSKEYDALLIPGGFAPDKLRRYPKVLELVREFDQAKKPIAFICHAGWVPISAKILRDRKATSTGAIRDDMENAGVIWSDAAVVVDGNLISSRTPKDLPAYCKAILNLLD